MYKEIKFPFKKSFKDCTERSRKFIISLHHPMIENMHVVYAKEVDPENDGYELSASSPCQSDAITILKKKIQRALSTRYLSFNDATELDMTHDRLIGLMEDDGILIDDRFVNWEQFISLIRAPGSQIDLIISDPAD